MECILGMGYIAIVFGVCGGIALLLDSLFDMTAVAEALDLAGLPEWAKEEEPQG